MDYKNKYLKYKTKFLNLRELLKGGCDKCGDADCKEGEKCNLDIANVAVNLSKNAKKKAEKAAEAAAKKAEKAAAVAANKVENDPRDEQKKIFRESTAKESKKAIDILSTLPDGTL